MSSTIASIGPPDLIAVSSFVSSRSIFAISATLIGCSTARNKGTCDNRVNIRRDELESRVLNALRTRLV
ncbi:zinc ribbon domain-containing protein, partial [Brucella anthropi]|uniref:zinc ribbon domain-containing protein n=1 Tax=Brucella anthropi TaxID=529 RepID=UPI0034E45124